MYGVVNIVVKLSVLCMLFLLVVLLFRKVIVMEFLFRCCVVIVVFIVCKVWVLMGIDIGV